MGAIVRHLFEEGLGAGTLSAVTDVLAPTHVSHVQDLPDLPPGPAGFVQFVTTLRGALFDLTVAVDDIVVRDGHVDVHWTASGRHERPLLGYEPAVVVGDPAREPGGKQATLSGHSVLRSAGGEIQESRTAWTDLEFE